MKKREKLIKHQTLLDETKKRVRNIELVGEYITEENHTPFGNIEMPHSFRKEVKKENHANPIMFSVFITQDLRREIIRINEIINEAKQDALAAEQELELYKKKYGELEQ